MNQLYDVYVKSRLTYCCETWTLTKKQYSKINSVHTHFLRRLIRRGLHRKSSYADFLNARKAASKRNTTLLDAVDWSYKLNSQAIFGITKCKDMPEYLSQQSFSFSYSTTTLI